ncbi:MAG: hypothetical protein Q8S44_02675, partial [Flavobacteriaceae bacterium]|nr:hypothetical protein [Flavobacteriaceae bacterium]
EQDAIEIAMNKRANNFTVVFISFGVIMICIIFYDVNIIRNKTNSKKKLIKFTIRCKKHANH